MILNPAISLSGGGVLPQKGKALNDYTWEEISIISRVGLGSLYFKVGDRKAVKLQGKASQLTLNDTLYVYILGFDHNVTNDFSAKNTIDFGGWKDASGKDFALMSGYNGDADFRMNPTNTNAGGWKNSDMRYTILGSTNTKNGDAGATTATSPVANTLMSCLPSDLRNVMKPITVWTDNAGGGNGHVAENVTSTIDYLPLLAEFEVFGSNTYANNQEANKQQQYEYYKSNSKVKYRYDSTSSTAHWWERSPSCSGSYRFCYVSGSGGASSGDAYISYGVAPAFRI